MQLLSEEKEFNSDESAFWDGSYLLDGIVDQNSYSQKTLTLNARLTPPRGGKPLSFEVSGSRTNLAEVINRTAHRGGKILIPAFALERAQEVVYALKRLREANRVPRIPVYVDSPLTVKLLQDHVKAVIAPYKYPRSVLFVDALPKTQTGKIQRFRLRDK